MSEDAANPSYGTVDREYGMRLAMTAELRSAMQSAAELRSAWQTAA